MSGERIVKGARYDWNGVLFEIVRVASNGTWADVKCVSGGATWTKRQPLPLPAGSVQVDCDWPVL